MADVSKKCARYAARILKTRKTKLLVRNTQAAGQPTEFVFCMPQQMSLDAVAALKAEGLLNAAAPNAARFLLLPGATVAGKPITGNMEIEYDGFVWELLDGGTRDLYDAALYKVMIGTRLRVIG